MSGCGRLVSRSQRGTIAKRRPRRLGRLARQKSQQGRKGQQGRQGQRTQPGSRALVLAVLAVLFVLVRPLFPLLSSPLRSPTPAGSAGSAAPARSGPRSGACRRGRCGGCAATPLISTSRSSTSLGLAKAVKGRLKTSAISAALGSNLRRCGDRSDAGDHPEAGRALDLVRARRAGGRPWDRGRSPPAPRAAAASQGSSLSSRPPPGKAIWPRWLGRLSGALGEDGPQLSGVDVERHQHRGLPQVARRQAPRGRRGQAVPQGEDPTVGLASFHHLRSIGVSSGSGSAAGPRRRPTGRVGAPGRRRSSS